MTCFERPGVEKRSSLNLVEANGQSVGFVFWSLNTWIRVDVLCVHAYMQVCTYLYIYIYNYIYTYIYCIFTVDNRSYYV